MTILRSLKHRPFALLWANIGFSLAGWATDLFGAPAVFLIDGLGTMALPLLGLFHPAIRNLD
jgi:hypothetical protein